MLYEVITVMTGFGRTGELFACLKAQVAPDLICLSKGLTGGALPMGVTVAEVEEIRRVEQVSGCKLMYGFNHRHHASIKAVITSYSIHYTKLYEFLPFLPYLLAGSCADYAKS